MKITVNRNELFAALIFASQDESRYVLNSVKIESKKDQRPLLIATDGRRLCAIESTADSDNLPDEDGDIILAADFIKPLCALSKSRGGKLFPWICIESNSTNKSLVVELLGCGIIVRADERAIVDAEYPQWRGIIPNKSTPLVPVSDIGLNAEYVGDFAKASKLMTDEAPQISMGFTSEDGVVHVRLAGVAGFYGVIMPCAKEERTNFQPSFLGI